MIMRAGRGRKATVRRKTRRRRSKKTEEGDKHLLWGRRWNSLTDNFTLAVYMRFLVAADSIAEERGMICWEYGAVDGAFSPWEGGRRGRRPRRERQRDSDPQSHGGRWHAPGQPHHAGQWGRAGSSAAVA